MIHWLCTRHIVGHLHITKPSGSDWLGTIFFPICGLVNKKLEDDVEVVNDEEQPDEEQDEDTEEDSGYSSATTEYTTVIAGQSPTRQHEEKVHSHWISSKQNYEMNFCCRSMIISLLLTAIQKTQLVPIQVATYLRKGSFNLRPCHMCAREDLVLSVISMVTYTFSRVNMFGNFRHSIESLRAIPNVCRRSLQIYRRIFNKSMPATRDTIKRCFSLQVNDCKFHFAIHSGYWVICSYCRY